MRWARLLPVVVVTLSLFSLLGCSADGHFYPVQGPLTSQSPPPVYVARFTGHPGARTLAVAVTLQGGEQASGTLSMDFPAPRHPAAQLPPMSAQWDAVYGQGSYTATVLGQGQDARGVLTGDKGTTVNLQVHSNGQDRGSLKGVAEDNRGNLYKVTF